MYIEGIVLEHFSAVSQIEIKPSKKSCPRHAVFHFFNDRKQDAATTTAHRKSLIKLFFFKY